MEKGYKIMSEKVGNQNIWVASKLFKIGKWYY